jgi:hypothetical protein
LPELNDASMPPIARTFQATCPPLKGNTGIDVSILTQRVTVSAEDVQSKLRQLLVSEDGSDDEKLFVTPHPTRAGSLVCHVYNIDRIQAIESARQNLDVYEIPTHFVQLETSGVDQHQHQVECHTAAAPKAADAASSIMQSSSSSSSSSSAPVEDAALVLEAVQDIFTDLLKLVYGPGPDANYCFHAMCGSSSTGSSTSSSMLASQVASKIRKRFAMALMNGVEVFGHTTTTTTATTSCNEIAKLLPHSNYYCR